MTLKEALRRFEEEYVYLALEATGGNVREAAVIIGCPRTHVYRLMGRCAITIARVETREEEPKPRIDIQEMLSRIKVEDIAREMFKIAKEERRGQSSD